MIRRSAARARRFLRNEGGSAGVEFALIAPVFLLIIAGTFEVGLLIRERLRIVSDVSAAAHHGLAIGAALDDASAPTVASTLAGLLADDGRTGDVDVNNAFSARQDAESLTVTEGSGAAESCYCLSRPDAVITWGGPVACNSACSDGSTAGRFVVISAQAPWSPMLFGGSHLFDDRTVQSTAVVRLP